MGRLILLIIVIFAVYKCTGGGVGTDRIFGPPDTLPLDRYEDMEVDVVFYRDDTDESENLGTVQGASACGSVAANRARALSLDNDTWGYVCCTHEAGSDCYRKIR